MTSEGIEVEKGEEHDLVPADTVILALGTRSENTLYNTIKDQHPQVLLIGDAAKPAKAYNAVHQAFEAALDV